MLLISALAPFSVSRERWESDGSIGIPVELETFVRDPASTGRETPHILYVVGTATERIGTDSDGEILSDLIGRGYIVTVVDYLGDTRSVSPALEWSLQEIKARLASDAELLARILGGATRAPRAIYVLPSGYSMTRQVNFWSLDRHGVAGSFDFIISVWNSDFLGVWGNKGIITYPDGRKQSVREYTESLPEGRVTSIYQCLKRDGKPIDMNLYMDILYPTHPRQDVPVMMYAQSGQDTVGTWNTRERPHLTGFLFGGYGVALFDFAFIPMSRTDNWGYFDGDGLGSVGGVTGDNYTYSLGKPNNMRANTAAVRFLRYLSATEHDTYRFRDDAYGVIGISKTGNTLRLGHPTPELLRESRFLEGHYGETRYELGDTEGDGMGEGGGDLMRGGEPQPWLTYPDGTPISSRVQFVNTSVGSAEYAITDGFVPIYSCGTMAKGGSYAAFWPKVMSRAYTHNVPALGYVCPEVGHSFGIGPDRDHGVDTMVALFEMADVCLKGAAPRCEYISPVDGSEVGADARIEICFNAPLSESELRRLTVVGDRGGEVEYLAVSSYGRTHWELIPRALHDGEGYTVTVPSDLVFENGRSIKCGYTSRFSVSAAERVRSLSLSALLDGRLSVRLPLTAPTSSLRFFVQNDAANTVLAHDGEGSLLGCVNLCGAGTYTIPFSHTAEGAIVLSVGRASGEYPLYRQSFDSYEMPSEISGAAVLTVSGERDRDQNGGGALKVADFRIEDKFAPYHRYYNGPNAFLTVRYAEDFSDRDYGRRLQFTASVYDTAVRQLGFTVGATSCVADGEPLVDCRAYFSNYTTRPGEWVDHSFRVDLKNPRALGAFKKNCLTLYGETWGAKNAECPIYLDRISVTETVTAVELSGLALIG